MSLLQCIGLVKQYPSKLAVDGVSFHVEPGEIVGLLGPNGAGKSTSFGMAVGLVTPTAGRVYFNGVDVTRWPLYKRAQHGMGYLPQKDSVFGKLSVEQNLYAVLEFQPLSYRDRMARADELLGMFELTEKRKQAAGTLSGGERRRCEIARCLASEPKLILLDEPFTGIDPKAIQGIQDMIADLRNRGISILFTDHRETETLMLTDRNYIVFGGHILTDGDAKSVLQDEHARNHYFGNRFDIDSILRARETFQRLHSPKKLDLPPDQAAA